MRAVFRAFLLLVGVAIIGGGIAALRNRQQGAQHTGSAKCHRGVDRPYDAQVRDAQRRS